MLLLYNATSLAPKLLGGGEMQAPPAQFLDPFPRIEIGPVDECKVGDLARVVGTVRNVDRLAGNVNRADSALVLQQPDVGQWREVERNEIGGPARLQNANAVAFGHKAGIDLGRRAQRSGRREAEILDKELELASIPFAVWGYCKSGIGSGQHRHTGGARLFPIDAADIVFAPSACGA